jgi:hypothetical protein
MTETQMNIAYIGSNLVAILLLVLSFKKKNLCRALFAVLFIWASWANWSTAHNNPGDYLTYDKYAIGLYKDIIHGFFAEHITSIVSFVAICQLLIGLCLLARGILVKLGCTGGMIFLLGIAPLGFGSAFPFSLIAGAALYILFRHNFEKDIFGNRWFT